MIRSTSDRYGIVAQRLHWASAAALLVMIPLGLTMARIDDGLVRTALYRAHVALGLVVLALTALRIIWRLIDDEPAPPPGLAGPRRVLFQAVHRAQYAVLVGLLGSGIAVLLGSHLRPWPPAVTPAAVDPGPSALDAHRVLAWIFIGLLVAHLAGIATYQATKGDTLGRMTGRWGGGAEGRWGGGAEKDGETGRRGEGKTIRLRPSVPPPHRPSVPPPLRPTAPPPRLTAR